MQIAEYLRLLPSEFSNSLAPPPKLTPLKFIFPQRFQTSLQNVKLIYPAGWDFSFHQFYFFFWNMASGYKSGFHLRSAKSPSFVVRQGDKLPAPFCCPAHLGALAELLWHEVEAAVSMVTSHSSSTSFNQHDQPVNWLTLKKKRVKIYRFIPLPLLCRLVKNNPNMAHWLLTRIIAGEYALNSCSAGERLMEGVLAACLSLRRERESVSPRGMDGAAVIVVNSSSVYAWANSLQTETGDILHTVFQTRTGPLN